VDRENVGWVVFDLPGEKVNKLTAPVLDHLRAVLDEALRRNVRGLVFVSDKPDMFVAGADVRDIAGVTDPRDGAEKAAYGQAVFEAIARFPRTTIAVITGPCLGGGYELALACTLRLVENRTAVRIGLPEVKLGILPGFGGTQRLPQRVGLRRALDLILTGKTLPAKPAFRRGLVDALVPPGEGRRIANEILMETRRLRAATPGRVDRFLAAVPPLRNFIFKRARAMVNRKARPEHYPAPHLALDAIAGGFGGSEVAAYANEARLLGEAIVTPASKNLTWLFMNSGKTKEPVGLDLSAASRPERTAVLGAGVMGGGIAWLAGEKGYPIRIRDIAPEALEGALRTAGTLWSKQVRRRRLTPSERDRRLEKLSFTLDLSGFNRVDFVFEAVVENLEIKRKVIAEVEAVLPDHAVIASNTSSLRIEDIAAGARRPERIVGLHFFNPVDRMPLVEVVAGPVSSARAVATAYKLALDLGKTPVLTADCPGFLINRLLAFYLGEALALFEQGVDAETMDRALTRFGMPMGPFTLLDQIGLDVADKVTAVVRSAYGDRLPEQQTVTRLADQGHLGRKSGRGFYVYGSKTARTPNPEAREAAGNPAPRTVPETEILDRLLLPMVNEAARCLEESVVRRALDVDLATVMGTGFPPFRGGLLRWADARGVEDILERLESWSEAQPRFRPSEALRARKDGIHPV
jgi:3-hydroxyacyl-CoA dehydrogenase/enoyl-CoA hydratase/3-hydroxybutyryl-CoA epimerase